ncbi:MAG: YdcF family protein, partial [Burkholderiales bacterium]|nr:YdcF family protein [Burkholderiales bacterium]
MKAVRKIWLWLGVLVALSSTLAAGFLCAGHFLQAPARAPVKADLLAALGGDNGARADKALELYRKGFAPRVLLTGPDSHSKTRSAYLDFRARYLVENGVPEKALLFDRA